MTTESLAILGGLAVLAAAVTKGQVLQAVGKTQGHCSCVRVLLR